MPADAPSDIATAAVYTLQLLARRVLEPTKQINDLKQRITQVRAAHVLQLIDHEAWGQTARPCRLSPLETTPNDCTARRPSPPCAVSGLSRRPRARPAPSTQSRWGSASNLSLALHRLIPAALGHS
jgi:hypothetical protein